MTDSSGGEDLVRPSTPARRAEHKVMSEFSPVNPFQPAWTASRCQRMLRQINSRVVALRNLRAACTLLERPRIVDGTLAHTVDGIDRSDGIEEGLQRCNDSGDKDDVDWEPTGKGRKRMKVYKGNTANALHNSISTTRRQRSHRYRLSDSTRGIPPLDDGHPWVKIAPVDKTRLRVAEAEIEKTEVLLHHAFKQVFHVTRGDTEWFRIKFRPTVKPKGAESLFVQCLKAVPHYIEQQEAMVPEKDFEILSQISGQTYEELEAWGSTTNHGWKPLRLVLRAHALKSICGAIQEGLLRAVCAYKCMSVCKIYGTYGDNNRICEAMSVHVNALSEQSTGERPAPAYYAWRDELHLSHFFDQMNVSGEKPVFFQALNDLLCHQIVLVEDLADGGLWRAWLTPFDALVSNKENLSEAIARWETIIQLSCGIYPANPMQRTEGCDLKLIFRSLSSFTDEVLTRMVLIITISWVKCIALLPLMEQSEEPQVATYRICSLAACIIRSRAVTAGDGSAPSKGYNIRQAIVLFAVMLLPALRAFEKYPPSLGFERIVTEWLVASSDADSFNYIHYVLGLGRLTDLHTGYSNYERHRILELFPSYLNWTSGCLRDAVQLVMDLVENGVTPNMPLPRLVRRDLLKAAVTVARQVANSRDDHRFDDWATGVEALEKARRPKWDDPPCDCGLEMCRECVLAGTDWYWDADLEEWVRDSELPRSALLATSRDDGRASRQTTPSAEQATSLSALTDTPMPINATSSSDPVVPGPTSEAALAENRPLPKGIQEDQEDDDPRSRLLNLSLDGCIDEDEVDELSVLQERPVNPKVATAREESWDEDDLSIHADRLRVPTAIKKPKRPRVLRKRRLASVGHVASISKSVGCGKALSGRGLKRKRSAMSLSDYVDDLSEDELTF